MRIALAFMLLASCNTQTVCDRGTWMPRLQRCVETDAQVDADGGDTGDASDDGADATPPPCGGCSGETPICEPASERCVECLLDADCGGTACDVVSGRCTNEVLGSLTTCRSCRRTSECEAGHYCVQQFVLAGQYVGNYCMPVAMRQNLYRSPVSAISVEGEMVQVHSFAATSTSCPAIDSHLQRTSCPTVLSCGAPDVNDGVCSSVSRCTLSCAAPTDCPAGFDCVASLCETS